ncbi:hypothetical protein GJAV_G00078760 [Gymnothorax javanicus]|nr:hypothetical protein GJAV_G00078760 [Gymnothorax javanicus]
MKKQKDCWYFMVLISLHVFIKDAYLERSVDSTVKLEQRMTLECICPWSGNFSMVSWAKLPENKQVAVFHPTMGVAASEEYNGRVEFVRSSQMDGSITIHNTTENDTGLYRCSIQTFPKGSWIKDILVKHLVDLDLSAADPMVIGTGKTFLMRCNYVDEGSVYQVTFEKVGVKAIDTIALCRKMEGRVEESFLSVDYKERVLVNCSDVLGASLRLINVIKDDGGVYRCHFKADGSGQTTTVSLTVSTDESSIHTPREMYMYIGGAVSGLILIISVITLICWQKRKKRRAKVGAKLYSMQRRLNRYEQAALYDRMKRGTKQQEELYANITTLPCKTKRKT